MVPAWLGWLVEEHEQALVRERMWPRVGERLIVPLLVCPDDLDFTCTLVVAEVSSTEDEVTWERVGLDVTDPRKHAEPGGEVNWFGIAPMHFPRGEYLAAVEGFRSIR